MTITVGVYLGKKDRFLRNWYDILPRGQFPLLVKYCIQSYLKGVYFPLDTICDRDVFREKLSTLQELAPTQRNVTFSSEDGPVFKWVEGVDNGYRSEEIKSILKDTIIHTLLEEHERTPLYHQRYRQARAHAYDSSWQGEQRERWSQPVVVKESTSAYPPAGSMKKDSIQLEELYNLEEAPVREPSQREETGKNQEQGAESYSRWMNRYG
ncbi:hypothetical protein [Desmospora profundinema]|uniref:Uncharacterized protein n=1 Tax=Desmospora profundinema TaxID=1571184 RepID=A0ABU1ILX0_9BACL|nr:hypothetical protein [Desmospora profundinema]MDR6225408.1 hypothetical protein [Desmospora profundinema]